MPAHIPQATGIRDSNGADAGCRTPRYTRKHLPVPARGAPRDGRLHIRTSGWQRSSPLGHCPNSCHCGSCSLRCRLRVSVPGSCTGVSTRPAAPASGRRVDCRRPASTPQRSLQSVASTAGSAAHDDCGGVCIRSSGLQPARRISVRLSSHFRSSKSYTRKADSIPAIPGLTSLQSI